MSTSSLTWLAFSLATFSSVTALPAEERRSVGQWVTATIDGKVASWQNPYSAAASTFATQTANAQSITSALSLATHAASSGAQFVTATIDGAVVSWVNDYPNSRSTNAAGDVEVTATIDGQVVSWANNWTPSAQSTATPSTSSIQTSTTSVASSPTNSASATAFPPPTTSGGLSQHGTLEQGYYPKHLPGNTTAVGGPPSNGSPWNHKLVSLDAYTHTNVPNTGVTRYYTFTLTPGIANADGVDRDVLLINGQFPGPTIEANWGDYIEVTVHNQLGNEGTSIHWHGLRQSQTPWMDGVPSLSQCPIAPGASFTYR